MATKQLISLITGGNSGIGFHAAQTLASSPKYHVIIGCRSIEKGQTAIREIKARNDKASISLIQLDITNDNSIADAVTSITKDFGRLDVLINNAGIISHATSFIQCLRETFETNTFGAANVTSHFAPLLVKSNDARLIYVSSGLGSIAERADKSDPYYALPASAYRMSKAAMNMMMVCHVAEYEPQGVKVWAFDPGYCVTNLSGTGEEGIKQRIDRGAGDPTVAGKDLSDIVWGKRDADVGKHIDGKGVHPW